MTTKIVASLVVSRAGGADGLTIVELDEVLNEGRTVFGPNDTINILIHHDSSVKIGWVRSTSGNVNSVFSDVMRSRVDRLLFIDIDSNLDLSYIPNGKLREKWYGNEASGLRLSSVRSVVVSDIGDPSICDVSYLADFTAASVTAPDVELEIDSGGQEIPYPLVIVVFMEAV